MATATTQQEIFWPAPIQGMVTENNYVQGPVQFARFLRNAIVSSGGIRQRHEQEFVTNMTAVASELTVWWNDYDDNEHLWSDGVIRTRTGTTVYTGTITNNVPYEGRFQDQIFLTFAGLAAIQKNGGTWGTFNYTLATLTASELAGAVDYKGRAYFWGTDATDDSRIIEYGALRAITGATTAYNITAFLQSDETILFCKAPTVEAGLQTGQVFVVYGDKGSVLIFDGDNPASWILTGRFLMPIPISRHSWLEIEGDIFVMSLEQIYSTRALFSTGTTSATENAITKPIQKIYQQIAQLGQRRTREDPRVVNFGYYLKEHNALVFSLGYASDIMTSDDDEWTSSLTGKVRRLQLVYFRDTKAFALWDIPQFNWPVRNQKAVASFPPYVRWMSNRVIFQYEPTGADYGIEPIEQGEDGSVFDSSQVEFVWTTPILTARAAQNAQVNGVRVFMYQDDGPHISALGVIGNGGDLEIQSTMLFLRDDDTSIGKISVVPVQQTVPYDQLQQLFAPVGLQEFFHCATMRLNKLNKDAVALSDDRTSTRRTEVFGMTVYFTPGGIF